MMMKSKNTDITAAASKTVFLWEEYIKTRHDLTVHIVGHTDKEDWTKYLYTDGFNIIKRDTDSYIGVCDFIALLNIKDMVFTKELFEKLCEFSQEKKYRTCFYDSILNGKRCLDDSALKIFLKKEGLNNE